MISKADSRWKIIRKLNINYLPEEQKKKKGRNMSRESEPCETTSSVLTNVMGVSEKEKRIWNKKITIKTMAKTFPNLIH